MYKVNVEAKQLTLIKPVKFSDLGIFERSDIQEWVSRTPEILGEGEDSLLILAKELPVNDDPRGIRLDLLALDRTGSLVVIELKRDDARGDVDWQSIKYAARCSRYQSVDIVSLLKQYNSWDENEARQAIGEHLEPDMEVRKEIDDEFINDKLTRTGNGIAVRIILVAREFHPDIASAVLWLRESEIDISCVRLKPFKDEENNVFVVPEKIIPLPETAHYTDVSAANKMVKIRTGSGYSSRTPVFANDQPSYPENELKNKLNESLKRKSNLTPRLKKFLEILVGSETAVDRESIKKQLYESKIGNNLGQAGRYLSNISQFVTKPDSGHLRQIISYESIGDNGQAGAQKNNFQIKDEYKELLKDVLKLNENL